MFRTLAVSSVLVTQLPADEPVVLLHGLCRTERSMRPMQRALEREGFTVRNVGYSSREQNVEELSESVLSPVMAECRANGAARVHFVAHSLGGILIRQYATNHPEAPIGRVVMLGPPNGGSEVVDRLGDWRLFSWINGPAGKELSTSQSSAPNRLGPVRFQAGVLAGNRSINWINSLMIEGPDDGKVSVERTKLDGMADHLILPVTHPFLMRNQTAIAQTIHFLRQGEFRR
jgi:pimeloyl-ACP methyl ester carboxylesterase